MQLQHSESIDKIAPALCAALCDIEHAQKNSINPHLRNKYADLGSVLDTVRPKLAKQKVFILQPMRTEDGLVVQQTVLMHESGQWVGSEAVIAVGDDKGLNKAQSFGLVISYFRRYQLQALVGIASEDDDGSTKSEKSEDKKDANEEPQETKALKEFRDKCEPIMDSLPPKQVSMVVNTFKASKLSQVPPARRREFYTFVKSLVDTSKTTEEDGGGKSKEGDFEG